MAPIERLERFSYSFHGCYRGWIFHVRYRHRTEDNDKRDSDREHLREDGQDQQETLRGVRGDQGDA